jgi:hypothetical protein
MLPDGTHINHTLVKEGLCSVETRGALLDLAPRGLGVSESSSRFVRARGRFNVSQNGECGVRPFYVVFRRRIKYELSVH